MSLPGGERCPPHLNVTCFLLMGGAAVEDWFLKDLADLCFGGLAGLVGDLWGAFTMGESICLSSSSVVPLVSLPGLAGQLLHGAALLGVCRSPSWVLSGCGGSSPYKALLVFQLGSLGCLVELGDPFRPGLPGQLLCGAARLGVFPSPSWVLGRPPTKWARCPQMAWSSPPLGDLGLDFLEAQLDRSGDVVPRFICLLLTPRFRASVSDQAMAQVMPTRWSRQYPRRRLPDL